MVPKMQQIKKLVEEDTVVEEVEKGVEKVVSKVDKDSSLESRETTEMACTATCKRLAMLCWTVNWTKPTGSSPVLPIENRAKP